jgi:hypothetical protein
MESSMLVWPLGVERQVGLVRGTQWLTGSSAGPHGGKKTKMKSCMVSWLSLKANTKLGRP